MRRRQWLSVVLTVIQSTFLCANKQSGASLVLTELQQFGSRNLLVAPMHVIATQNHPWPRTGVRVLAYKQQIDNSALPSSGSTTPTPLKLAMLFTSETPEATASPKTQSSSSLLSQPLTESAAAEFLSAVNENPDSKTNSWTILAVADYLFPAHLKEIQVDGIIRTHVKVARKVHDKLEKDGIPTQAKEFRTRMQVNAKKIFRGAWNVSLRLYNISQTV